VGSTVVGGGRGGLRGARRQTFLAAVAVLALVLVAIGLAPHPSSRAATGAPQAFGQVFVGSLDNRDNKNWCTATLVRPWMAITAKHCGTGSVVLRLGNVMREDGDPAKMYSVSKIVPNAAWDVEALYLKHSAPWDDGLRWGDGFGYDATSGERIRVWGFGRNVSDTNTGELTMAQFGQAEPCPKTFPDDAGNFCFDTSSLSNICAGDSGAPITQGNRIVAMETAGIAQKTGKDFSCADNVVGVGIPITKIAGWLHDRSCEAAPRDTWPCG
jgi:Trypsin